MACFAIWRWGYQVLVSHWSRTYDRCREQHVPLLNTTVYIGVTIFALVRSCRRVDRLETTRLLSATGVRTFDRGRERHVRLRTQGACWLCPGVEHDSLLQLHDCARWCHHLCLVYSLDVAAPGDCSSAINAKVQHRPMFLPAIPFLVEPIGFWASTVARLQEARRHSQGLAELELPFSVVVTASVIHGIMA